MTRSEDRWFATIVRRVFPTAEKYILLHGDKLSQEQANCPGHAVISHAPVVPLVARTRSPTRQQHTACPGIPLALALGVHGMERRTDVCQHTGDTLCQPMNTLVAPVTGSLWST